MSDEKTGSDFFKIEKASNYLGVTRRWLYRRIWNGDLPASKVGGLYFIRRQDLDELMIKGRVKSDIEEMDVTPEVLLKCGYCFRILEIDVQIGDLCATDNCEALICNRCLADGVRYCAEHTPDLDQQWEKALHKYREGDLVCLVKANQARLREVNMIQRLQTRLMDISTLRHPISGETLDITNWPDLVEENDERAEIMELMNKAILEKEWLNKFPLNASVQYQIQHSSKKKGSHLLIMAKVMSRTKEMIRIGFDTQPLGMDDMSPQLVKIGDAAQRNQTFTLLLLGSTTGWDEEVRSLILGKKTEAAFVHNWLFVYLSDLEKHDVIFNRYDARLRNYSDLFTYLLPDEEVE